MTCVINYWTKNVSIKKEKCIVKTIFIGKFRGWIASDFKTKLVQFEAEKKRQLFSTLEYNIYYLIYLIYVIIQSGI